MRFFCSISSLRVAAGMNRISEGGMTSGISKVTVVRECKLSFELTVIVGGGGGIRSFLKEWNRLKSGNSGILIAE